MSVCAAYERVRVYVCVPVCLWAFLTFPFWLWMDDAKRKKTRLAERRDVGSKTNFFCKGEKCYFSASALVGMVAHTQCNRTRLCHGSSTTRAPHYVAPKGRCGLLNILFNLQCVKMWHTQTDRRKFTHSPRLVMACCA